MRNNYVGDIGDYWKLLLLRRLVERSATRLGVIWYLTRHPEENNDGQARGYLQVPARWRGADPELFDRLRTLEARWLAGGELRHVRLLETGGFLPDETLFVATEVPGRAISFRERGAARMRWWAEATAGVARADVVFLDPDNGLLPAKCKSTEARADKYALPDEIRRLLARGQAVVLYQHLRRTGWAVLRDDVIETVAPNGVGVVARAGTRAFFIFTSGGEQLRRLAGCLAALETSGFALDYFGPISSSASSVESVHS